MRVQFFPALIETIDQPEERFRIGSVNGDRHIECASGFPHRVETAIIDANQLTLRDVLPQIKSERL